MKKSKIRHILGLSGGKDSTALAILLHREIEDLEYFFCDTHKELPETYEYLKRIEARLGIHIHYLSAHKGFDYWLAMFKGYLPSPKSRWCTRKLKIEPLEEFIGDDHAVSYVGIRADEPRDGRSFTWNEGETLQELAAREDAIMKDHAVYREKQSRNSPNKTLAEALADVLNDESAVLPCLKG